MAPAEVVAEKMAGKGTGRLLSTGRRKEASARVWIQPAGSGKILINERPLETYFPRSTDQMLVRQPLKMFKAAGEHDFFASVTGGGLTGQAGAVRLGIARALLALDSTLKASLRQYGLLTRDSRAKERKKYGRKGARRAFQYSKR